MKLLINTLLLALILILLGQQASALSTLAKGTIHVVDEEGNDIEGAKAGFAFEKNSAIGPGVDVITIDGYTNSKGRFTARNSSDSNVIFYSAEKNGY